MRPPAHAERSRSTGSGQPFDKLRANGAEAVLPTLWALLIALAASTLLLLALGRDPVSVYRLFVTGTFGSGYGFGQVLFKMTPLLFTGLAVAVALKGAGLFNVGGEGQITFGAFCAAWVGAHLPAAVPHALALAAALGAAFFGGAFVGAIAGVLRALRGSHEVITTIMLNFIVRAAMLGIGLRLFLRESIHTAPIVDAARLHRLADMSAVFKGSAVNESLLVALLVACGLAVFLRYTVAGFRLRAVGQAPLAAESSGISVKWQMVFALVLSGGLAGLGGSNFVLGYKYYYEDGFSGGVGFLGIAAAVLGRNHPLGVVAAAFLLGLLSQGALAINAEVPKELVDVLIAVLLIATTVATPEVRRLLSSLPSRVRQNRAA